ncbi:translocation and assembly module lipoprotein TamL [Desertivirga arenae]|uniref:translocation and assembly module lipoprotein TamL n=1 Tax=Desertivirga arenae TaxID=2810309 RepID=UPI001F616571|nr:BamA/TamA family outer membrane protein [Pedobacter sp. SYSU D00823]
MKAYLNVYNFLLASIALLLLIFSGCSATRYLNDNEALVRSSRIKGVDNEFTEEASLYIQQNVRPNSRLNLALYNLLNTKNGKYRTDRIKDIGEAPHILDSTMVEISRNEIEKFLIKKGYFRAKVKAEVEIEKKKAYVTFLATQGPSYKLRNYSYEIADSAVKELYVSKRSSFTQISKGMRYDEDSLKYESNQVFEMLKNNGYYDYVQQYMHCLIDTNVGNNLVDVKAIVDNPPNRDKHLIYSINNTHITVNTSNGDSASRKGPDSLVVDSQYYFKDYSGRFRFKPFSKYIFFNKFDLYDNEKRDLTYNRLYELNVFKNISIEYTKRKDDTTTLDVNILATPLKKMSNRVEGEFTFNSGSSGFNVGNTYSNRNVFGGAEQLDIKFRYGILRDSRDQNSFYNRDFQVGANLTFPRLLAPFRIPSMGRYGIPRTTISSSLQISDWSKALSNRLFINSITYNWAETQFKVHSLTPINIEYRDGRLDPAFRDTLIEQGNSIYVETNDRQYINLGSQYSFTFNNIKLNSYENFIYFRSFTDLGGNTLALLANALDLPKNSGVRTLFRLRYLQYAKTEFDLRWYRSLGGERQFIARIYPGIAYPYGNSSDLPFEKKFYVGGSTGIRAWQARTLGPGNYNRSVRTQEVRERLTNLDQLGEIKLEGNLEYRFKMLDNLFGAKLKGAVFGDYGNVWAFNKLGGIPSAQVQLKLNELFNQIAIGTGAGLRFDLDYFVFRFDVGIKVKDPQFGDEDQWVIKHLFNNKEFKEQYKLTNSPDRYNFLQYNFGIGLPF